MAAFEVAAAALPPVILQDDCPLVQTYDATAEGLIAFVAQSGQEVPPDYMAADLESGTGDGVPDYYQLMLLAAALCSGDEDLNQTFASNRAAVADYLGVFDDLVQWGVTARAHASVASDELDLFMAWPLYNLLVPEEYRTAITALTDGLATLLEATEFLTDYSGELGALLAALPELTDIIAGAAGLSSAMHATFETAAETMLADVLVYQSDVVALADTVELAAEAVGLIFFYTRSSQLKASLLAVAGDLRALADLLDRLHFPALDIYGAPGEPFSGSGDYDGDGHSNTEVYIIVSGKGGGIPEFVKAASGADRFYASESVPTAGTVGLAALSIITAIAGAVVLFRRPRACSPL